MMRDPDVSGPSGSAWRIRTNPPQLSQWLVRAPGRHPCWEHWLISVIHLRDMEGVPPATLQAPNAEYELNVLALNPDKPLPDVDASPDEFRFHYLTPVDQSIQFAIGRGEANGDIIARALGDECARWVAQRGLNPDEDYRYLWARLVDDYLKSRSKDN